MKFLIMSVIVCLSQFSFADDSAPFKVTINGEQANQVASLAFLSRGEGPKTVFSTGVVKVTCHAHKQPSVDPQAEPQPPQYVCTFSQAKVSE